MNIPDEVLEAAEPYIASFFARRGSYVLRGKEAQALASYVLKAAAPHLMAQAWDEGAEAEFDRGKFEPLVANPYRSQT